MDNTSNGPMAGGLSLTPPEKKKVLEIVEPGHRYNLYTYGERLVPLNFIQKRPAIAGDEVSKQDEMVVEEDGVTTEAVIAVLISRLHYLESMVPCSENLEALAGLNVALNALERRTRNRQMRRVEGTNKL